MSILDSHGCLFALGSSQTQNQVAQNPTLLHIQQNQINKDISAKPSLSLHLSSIYQHFHLINQLPGKPSVYCLTALGHFESVLVICPFIGEWRTCIWLVYSKLTHTDIPRDLSNKPRVAHSC